MKMPIRFVCITLILFLEAVVLIQNIEDYLVVFMLMSTITGIPLWIVKEVNGFKKRGIKGLYGYVSIGRNSRNVFTFDEGLKYLNVTKEEIL